MLKSQLSLDLLYRLGGMCGAIITSPFDVVKTRLQSSLFQDKHANINVIGPEGVSAVVASRRPGGLLYNFVETGHILRFVLFSNSSEFALVLILFLDW